MKYTKKFMLVMGIIMSICLTGCKDSTMNNESKMEIEGGAQSTLEAEQVENDYFAYNIPEGWIQSPIQINDSAISIVNSYDKAIDVMILPDLLSLDEITMQDYKLFIEANLLAQPGCEIKKIEVQERAIGDIIYVEMKSVVTKEFVQSMIDSGVITQEAIDADGGLGVYAKGLYLRESAAYYMYDNNVLIIDGRCTSDGDIEEVRTQVNAIIDTIKVK